MKSNLNELAIIAVSDSKEKEAAKNLLFANYERIIRQIISKHGLFLSSGSDDDLLQEGFLGLLEALNGYDKTKGSFPPFAWRVIERKLLDAVRADTRKKNTILSEACDLNSENIEDNSDPFQTYIVTESRERIEKILKEILNPRDYKIFLLYRDGRSYKEISHETGLNLKSIDNALQRIKKRIVKNPIIFSE